MSTALLDVKHLCVDVHTPHGPLRVVNDVSFTVQRGEAVGLVGESGSGKSMTAFAVINLFPSPLVRISSGEVWLEGRQLSALTPRRSGPCAAPGWAWCFRTRPPTWTR